MSYDEKEQNRIEMAHGAPIGLYSAILGADVQFLCMNDHCFL